ARVRARSRPRPRRSRPRGGRRGRARPLGGKTPLANRCARRGRSGPWAFAGFPWGGEDSRSERGDSGKVRPTMHPPLGSLLVAGLLCARFLFVAALLLALPAGAAGPKVKRVEPPPQPDAPPAATEENVAAPEAPPAPEPEPE